MNNNNLFLDKKNWVSTSEFANKTLNWATVLSLKITIVFLALVWFVAIPSLTVQDCLTWKLRLFKAHKMQIKCQNDFPLGRLKLSNENVWYLSVVSSFPNSSLDIATYGMNLDQPCFNQKAFSWKQSRTITHSSCTTSQLVPSLSRVKKFSMASLCSFSCFPIFSPLNSKEKGFEIFCGTNLMNCIYSTSDKPNAKSRSGLNSTLLASCRAVYDIDW